jgi:hypothetical protein
LPVQTVKENKRRWQETVRPLHAVKPDLRCVAPGRRAATAIRPTTFRTIPNIDTTHEKDKTMSNTNTNTATTNSNGKAPRKTLADQLDRLDNIIDALATGLNETVAEVVKQAVTVAVQQAIEGVVQAVVQNPELLRALVAQVVPPAATAQPATPASAPPRPSRVKAGLSAAWGWLRQWGKKLRVRLGVVWQFRRQTLTAVAFGVFTGAVASTPSQAVASVLAGVGGVALSLLVMAGLALRRAAQASSLDLTLMN